MLIALFLYKRRSIPTGSAIKRAIKRRITGRISRVEFVKGKAILLNVAVRLIGGRIRTILCLTVYVVKEQEHLPCL